LCRTYRTEPRKVATVTRAPSAVRTRVMLTRGLGISARVAVLRVAGAGLALGVLRAAAVDCAAAGDAVDGGCAAADAPPHAATAQATASALATGNVCLIMLPSMRRPASDCPCGSLTGALLSRLLA
jgi:hypothetical protein